MFREKKQKLLSLYDRIYSILLVVDNEVYLIEKKSTTSRVLSKLREKGQIWSNHIKMRVPHKIYYH